MITNNGNVSLPMAVWLASDEYDLGPRQNVISATGALKPIKAIVLGQRIAAMNANADSDVLDQVPSSMGTAIHTAVERAWSEPYRTKALKALEYPQAVIDRIKVNPNTDLMDAADHNIFIEIRTEKALDGYIISGQFDFVEAGRVKDIKTTGTYNWIHGGNDNKYAMQGSIYRWLNPHMITDDHMDVEFVFTDWKPIAALADRDYPQQRVMTRTLPLKDIAWIHQWLQAKIRDVKKYLPLPEERIPNCSEEDLWQRPTTWAYYRKTTNKKATKVFDNSAEANTRMATDGGTGKVVVRPGEVKFCKYCNARPICKQAARYIAAGLIKE